MKKILLFLISILLVFGMAGVAGATIIIENYIAEFTANNKRAQVDATHIVASTSKKAVRKMTKNIKDGFSAVESPSDDNDEDVSPSFEDVFNNPNDTCIEFQVIFIEMALCTMAITPGQVEDFIQVPDRLLHMPLMVKLMGREDLESISFDASTRLIVITTM